MKAIKNIDYFYTVFPRKFIDNVKRTQKKGTIMNLRKITYDGIFSYKAIV